MLFSRWFCFHYNAVYYRLIGFNVRLEYRTELLPTVWDSFLRMIRGHATRILSATKGMQFNIKKNRGILLLYRKYTNIFMMQLFFTLLHLNYIASEHVSGLQIFLVLVKWFKFSFHFNHVL